MTAIIFCFLLLLSGCSANGETQPPDNTAPAQTEQPIPTNTPHPTQTDEEQPPDLTVIEDTEPAEPESTVTVDFIDGTEARLIVNGRELTQHWAVLIGGEALVPDFTYVFGSLNDADGQCTGFFSIGVADTNTNLKTAVIMNPAHNITIVEGEYSFTHNDAIIPLTVPAQMIRDTFHVPLMAIADAIGATVEWDEAAQAISFFFER